MLTDAAQPALPRRFQLRERRLAQYAARDLAACVGMPAAQYFAERIPVAGFSRRFAAREGLDVLAHDVEVLEASAQEIQSEPCLALTLMFEGRGEGVILGDADGPDLGVGYGPMTWYASFSTRTLKGRSTAPGGSRYRLVELRISHAFLDRLGRLEDLMALDARHPRHCMSRPGIWVAAAPVTPALAQVGEQLHAIARGDHVDDLLLDARALEFLMLSMEMIAPREAVRQEGLDTRRRRQVEQAAALLRADLAHPWTIAALARRVGLGEKTLKQGFRQLFGVGVIGYLQDQRLWTARTLLIERGVTVTDAALQVGYVNLSHFARLYRRAFGVSPGQAARADALET
ncbi:helix-turn-helix transcriptional regulator [Caulobacter segnis]|uniref:helix-turn-helix transcriptional regulator n=1 Tax=Caulobacter segnis TaxID=88688 RepID=UPI002859876A|nr:helix-turn-helix transcriptional regulator [Caulobacter segnis]MDR6623834.1 AraC-like DNA-binding protein [Caulobacter segnis]